MKKRLWVIICFILLSAPILTAVCEDALSWYQDRELLYYGDFAYVLRNGGAVIVDLADAVIELLDTDPPRPGMSDISARVFPPPGDPEDGVPFKLTVPEKLNGYRVIAIGDGAFFESMFTQITLPEGIRSIGENAFAYSYYLDTIILPKSAVYIADYAFYNCEMLKSAAIPVTVQYIGPDAFAKSEDSDGILPVLIVEKDSYAEKFAKANSRPYRYTNSEQVYNQGIHALAIDNLATRSGPSTAYTGLGTYKVKGNLVRVISYAYDRNQVCWVQCDVIYGKHLRRVYTGLKRLDTASFDLYDLPEERKDGEKAKIKTACKAMYGPGEGYGTYSKLTLKKGQNVTLITVENQYAQVEWVDGKVIYRVWIPSSATQ